jgi:NADH-quinone oxidoreductase subunit F
MDEILLKKIGHPGYNTLPGYRETGGYEALHWALSHRPEDVIDEIMRSGLRGRGGGGYPSGLMWQGVAQTGQTI